MAYLKTTTGDIQREIEAIGDPINDILQDMV